MPTPRQSVQNHILTSLQSISQANGYHLDVETVQWAQGLLRELNSADLPAISIFETNDDPQLDRHGGETMGGRSGNEFFRVLKCTAFAYLTDPGDRTLDDVAELFIADIERCLIKNRQASDARLPEDIHYSFTTSNFERIQNMAIVVKFELMANYNFREADL